MDSRPGLASHPIFSPLSITHTHTQRGLLGGGRVKSVSTQTWFLVTPTRHEISVFSSETMWEFRGQEDPGSRRFQPSHTTVHDVWSMKKPEVTLIGTERGKTEPKRAHVAHPELGYKTNHFLSLPVTWCYWREVYFLCVSFCLFIPKHHSNGTQPQRAPLYLWQLDSQPRLPDTFASFTQAWQKQKRALEHGQIANASFYSSWQGINVINVLW